jgi:hypothetical protein
VCDGMARACTNTVMTRMQEGEAWCMDGTTVVRNEKVA